MSKKSLIVYPALLALGCSSLLISTPSVQAGGFNPMNMMNPGKWFGGNSNRRYYDDDYYYDRYRYGPGYGYGGWGGPGWGGYGPYGYGWPGYGYGYGAPGYGAAQTKEAPPPPLPQ